MDATRLPKGTGIAGLLAAVALTAGCGAGTAGSGSKGPRPQARGAPQSVAGTLHSAGEVVRALRGAGFAVRRYPIRPDSTPSFVGLRRRGVPVSSAIVGSGMVQALVATPRADRGSRVLIYVTESARDGLIVWNQNGEYTDPQRLPPLRYRARLSVRGNVVALYLPPRRGRPGPARRAAFLAAMASLDS